MRVKLLIPIVMIFMVMVSCTKEEVEKNECETKNIGYLTITSTSENPYHDYLNEIYIFTMEGNMFSDNYKIAVGIRNLKLKKLGTAFYNLQLWRRLFHSVRVRSWNGCFRGIPA